MDDSNIALYGFELLEIPLKGLKILQERRLSVRTRHGGHELIRQIRQFVRKRVSDESQFLDCLEIRISFAQSLSSDRVDEVLGGSQLS